MAGTVVTFTNAAAIGKINLFTLLTVGHASATVPHKLGAGSSPNVRKLTLRAAPANVGTIKVGDGSLSSTDFELSFDGGEGETWQSDVSNVGLKNKFVIADTNNDKLFVSIDP